MTTALLALTLFAIMVAALRVMPKVRRGQPWSPEKAIDARPHLRIADDPEIPRLLERGHYEEP
jgi:hypothetical protein